MILYWFKQTRLFALLWAVFGNDDEPQPPSWYVDETPDWRPWFRRFVWLFVRNPLHNFCFYVIGIADKDFTSTGRYPEHVWNPEGGWNWAWRRYKWLWLPFVSYEGEWTSFYIGWREKGNFGVKLTWRRISK